MNNDFPALPGYDRLAAACRCDCVDCVTNNHLGCYYLDCPVFLAVRDAAIGDKLQ